MRRVKYLQRDNTKEKEIKLRHNNNENVLKVLINNAHDMNLCKPGWNIINFERVFVYPPIAPLLIFRAKKVVYIATGQNVWLDIVNF